MLEENKHSITCSKSAVRMQHNSNSFARTYLNSSHGHGGNMVNNQKENRKTYWKNTEERTNWNGRIGSQDRMIYPETEDPMRFKE
jgi:poly(3-hydroxyalkanoate) synthetase